MEHLVKFISAEGREGQHQADNLDDALRFVERLRNREGASEVRVYRINEVPIEFRTYYKVELATPDGGDVPAAPSGEPVAEASEAESTPSRPLVATSSNGEGGEGSGRRLFGR